jgi:hypothetical protein
MSLTKMVQRIKVFIPFNMKATYRLSARHTKPGTISAL